MKEPGQTRFWLVKQFFSVVCSLSRISESVIIDGFLGSVLQIITRTERIPFQNNNLFQILDGTLIFSHNAIKSKWNAVDVTKLAAFQKERIVKVVCILNNPHFFSFFDNFKTFLFSDVFREQGKGVLGTNGLNLRLFHTTYITLPFNTSCG